MSTSTVTKVCSEARPPITFDRAATKAATEARVVDLKARRAAIAERFATRAEELLDLMSEQHTVTSFHEGEMVTGIIDRPTSGDIKNYMTAAGIAIDKTLTIERHDSDDRDLPSVDRWLAAMIGTGE